MTLLISLAPDLASSTRYKCDLSKGGTSRTAIPAGRPTVAIVNEAFAHKFFASSAPIGQYLSAVVIGRHADLQIVGIVKNVDLAGLRKADPPAVYVSYYQLLTHLT